MEMSLLIMLYENELSFIPHIMDLTSTFNIEQQEKYKWMNWFDPDIQHKCMNIFSIKKTDGQISILIKAWKISDRRGEGEIYTNIHSTEVLPLMILQWNS